MYPTALTDSQWEVIKNILDDGRKRKHSLRLILDALFYLLKSGCQWGMLPRNFPPYSTVYYYFSRWKQQGHWQRLNQALVRLYRQKKGRKPSPSCVLLDSWSVKNSEWGLPDKGFDGYKRIKGRKRHLSVDLLGLLLAAVVTPAHCHDSRAAPLLLSRLKAQGYKRIRTLVADQAYRSLSTWIKQVWNWNLEISTGLRCDGFTPQARRWRIERTISWLQWNRRLAKDFEADTSSSQAFLYIANIFYIIRKLE